MLELIRNHAKGLITWFILGLVILALASFVLTGYSLNSVKDYVAMVNGEKISEGTYQRAYSNYQRSLQQNLGENYRPDLINENFLKQTVVNGLVDRELMHQLLDEAGFRVGGQQITGEISKVPAFQGVDNKFSDDAFSTTLKRMGLSKQHFQQEYAYDFSLQQLNDAISKSTFAAAYQADDYQRLAKQQRDIGYVQIAHEKFAHCEWSVPAPGHCVANAAAHSVAAAAPWVYRVRSTPALGTLRLQWPCPHPAPYTAASGGPHHPTKPHGPDG